MPCWSRQPASTVCRAWRILPPVSTSHSGVTSMPRVVHFEIHAENPERAVEFYKNLFGWEFTQWAGPQEYWIIKTGPDHQRGINGGMIRRRGDIDGMAVIAYVCTVDVASVDATAQKVAVLGGTIV